MGAKDLTQYLEEKDKCGQIVKDWAVQVRGEYETKTLSIFHQ